MGFDHTNCFVGLVLFWLLHMSNPHDYVKIPRGWWICSWWFFNMTPLKNSPGPWLISFIIRIYQGNSDLTNRNNHNPIGEIRETLLVPSKIHQHSKSPFKSGLRHKILASSSSCWSSFASWKNITALTDQVHRMFGWVNEVPAFSRRKNPPLFLEFITPSQQSNGSLRWKIP